MRNKGAKSLCSLLLLLLSSMLLSYRLSNDDVTGKLIWKGEKYAAFTSLVYYKGDYYCAFRNAQMHYDPTGKDCGSIKIIRSKDVEHWEEFLNFSVDNYDLRDPQLSVTPTGKLMLLTERVLYVKGKSVKRHSCVSFIDKDGSFSVLAPISFNASPDRNWIWNVSWIDGEAYGFCYNPYFAFVKSKDGANFELIERLRIESQATETSVVKINKNELFAVARTHGNALIGVYNIKDKVWKWEECAERIDCPKIITVKKDIFVIGRSYVGGKKTSLYKYNKETNKLECIKRISGGRDCAYPGIVYKDGYFYISYYIGEKEQSDIYMILVEHKF